MECGCADGDRKALDKSCKAYRQAYESCVKAYGGVTKNCGVLETAVVQCMAKKICPEAEDAFQKCVAANFSLENESWALDACDKEVAAMKKCLKRFGVYPIQVQLKR